ncbi:TIR domain-containing protein [Tissierella sp. MSJ-40]|uniref:TIR domain-containing protein n=1 Tax=Tissierella simiarum TaxID=2841534 RepID=A0ABS6EBA2_9FIRM|nr:TIR domain-containing protein [Tissierella simiarum]MBU5439806.1 TIR domain-containing protein [Tissierella simiarum]
MAYRNGTYVAFDGNGTTNPTEGDMKYYGLLRKWNNSNKFELTFSDSHLKTYQVKDSSSVNTLKSRLLERMKNSKNMLLIISDDTNWDRGMLNYEIEKAVDYYKIPLIVAYTGYNSILYPSSHRERWPKALLERIDNGTAKCIHIPFKERAISSAVSQFSVNSTGDDILTSPLTTYKKEAYINWGYIDK